jgi:hypothetical protein
VGAGARGYRSAEPGDHGALRALELKRLPVGAMKLQLTSADDPGIVDGSAACAVGMFLAMRIRRLEAPMTALTGSEGGHDRN